MVIGTFAYCGSGQDTLADGFCKYKDYTKYSLGDVIRDIAKERKLPQSREVLRMIRKEYDEKYGKGFIPETIIGQIQCNRPKNIIITGIRTIEEYEIFKTRLGMILVFVYANKSIRFQRMLKRCEEKDCKSIEELEEQMVKEKKLFDYEKLKKNADYFFTFEITLDEYLESEQKIVSELYDKLKNTWRY